LLFICFDADSLPELDRNTAERYLDEIAARASAFLSINHEANAFTVRDLLQKRDDVVSYERFPYWMRRGYAEEIIRFLERPVTLTKR
jgi:hypothetical protein